MEDSHHHRHPWFNGGKMEHIFHIDTETKLYTSDCSSDEAAQALAQGTLTVKIDGSNGMLRRDRDDNTTLSLLSAYQRLDTRGKPIPPDCLELPPGRNADTYQCHSYCYEPITLTVSGKKLLKRNAAMLAVIERHEEYFLALGLEFISIEWVGTKFNRTPGVPHEVAIAIHKEQVCEETVERTYDGMRAFLLEANPPMEGLVVEYEGRYWKIRADCFDRACAFKRDPSTARAPVFLV